MAETAKTLGIALVGCGTVGGAVASLLTRDHSVLRDKVQPQLQLRHVVDVDLTRARALGLDESLLCRDPDKALNSPATDVVVELVGGTTFARDLIERALRAGKHVVTANKALLAHHGAELCALARQCGVCIAFEASCAGGIPIVRALYDGLIANRIDAFYGIVNGTCNYILTAMTRLGQDYPCALAQAQKQGLAEADPSLDVSGTDSAHKLAILAALAFQRKIDLDTIPAEGIDSLDFRDVAYGLELGYVVKLLAIAQRKADGLSLRVRPAMLSRSHPLAWVDGPFNAISVYGHATGHTMYYGRGAGGMPTASAVVADLVSVALGIAPRLFQRLQIWPDLNPAAHQLPMGAIRSRYYIRVLAEDKPSVLAKVATVLGNHNISISSVLQHEAQDEADDSAHAVPVVITTHCALEGDVRHALAQVDAMEVIKGKSVCIAIVDEHPEGL